MTMMLNEVFPSPVAARPRADDPVIVEDAHHDLADGGPIKRAELV